MSVRILLDTHIALWAVTGSARLPGEAEEAIVAAEAVFVSAASIWEIAIKHALGRGDMPVSADQAFHAFLDAGYEMLDVRPEHALRLERLPALHKDPFDRLLVAQALDEPLTLVTRDEQVARYSDSILRVS